jgi:hypothetical protein
MRWLESSVIVDGAIRAPTHAGRGNNDLLRGADSRPGIVLREVRWVRRNPGRVVGALFAIRDQLRSLSFQNLVPAIAPPTCKPVFVRV